MTDAPRAGGVLGRLSGSAQDPVPGSTPERTALASPVDVLLASADDVVRGRMAGVLRRSAHTVVEAESAAEAVEAVRRGARPGSCSSTWRGPRPRNAGPSPPSARSPLARARPSSSSPGWATTLVEAVRRLCGTLGG